jgi:hypothetical protein
MKKWKFNVTETETYEDEIEVEAESKEEAEKILIAQLNEEPLGQRKNTYCGSELTFELI